MAKSSYKKIKDIIDLIKNNLVKKRIIIVEIKI
jgi:hypothetical protein